MIHRHDNSEDQKTMDKYDNLGIIGEGSYGVVIKCRHKQSGQVCRLLDRFKVIIYRIQLVNQVPPLSLKNSIHHLIPCPCLASLCPLAGAWCLVQV